MQSLVDFPPPSDVALVMEASSSLVMTTTSWVPRKTWLVAYLGRPLLTKQLLLGWELVQFCGGIVFLASAVLA